MVRDDVGGIPRGKVARLSRDRELHYHDAGSGPAVLFIHGSGPGASGYSNFKGNFPRLARAGYRTLVPDMIGYGYSSKPEGVDYDLDLFCETLFELLDDLGEQRATLVGNSLGGAVAISMALRRPERIEKLVLMAPGGVEPLEVLRNSPDMKRMFAQFLGEGFTREGLGDLLRGLTSDPGVVTPELVNERYPIYLSQPLDVLRRMKVPDMTARLGELTMPILGFWGIEDRFCPVSGAQKFLAACPDCRFVIYAKCGHWVMVEYADEFNSHVERFLSR